MSLWRIGRVGICGALIAGGAVRPAGAQGSSGLAAPPVQLADRGDDHRPAFFSLAPNGARVDVRNASALRRRVSLTLIDVPLGDAVHAIARQAGLDLTYSTELIPVGARVSLRADDITVVAALTDILVDAGLDVELTGATRLTLVRRWAAVSAERRQQGTATITGHVSDGALKTPLAQVTVRAEGTSASTSANADGRYVLDGLAPGTYRVTARRVGYQPLTKEITLTGTERTTLDFALVAAPTRLDEVVTTAVGEQRRYEVGNTISTINADSITPTAPITSLTDLISARAPGVEVVETSGMTGSGESIRIRGLSSLVLQNDPILIVDGVRQDNSAGGDLGAAFFSLGIFNQNPTPSRLNDIDFADVATIDILKGPAASTEYGTDAANGVVVITTKHGTAGPPQWRASAEQTASDIPPS
jgi:TonB-dependent SusC/RagA subfamily outer membrane receptor